MPGLFSFSRHTQQPLILCLYFCAMPNDCVPFPDLPSVGPIPEGLLYENAVYGLPNEVSIPFRLPLLVAGTFYHSKSLLYLRYLFSSHVSKLTILLLPTPVLDHVQCPRSDTLSFWTL